MADTGQDTPPRTPLATIARTPPSALWLLPLAALFVVLGGSTVASLVPFYTGDPDFSHGFLVPLVSVYAVWQRRHGLKVAPDRFAPAGLVLLAAGVILTLSGIWYGEGFGAGAGHVLVRGMGLIASLAGVCWYLLGTRSLGILGFPLLFLFLALPFPAAVTSTLSLGLRDIVSAGATAALRVLGVSVLREGNVLQFARGAVGIEDACSGIRSINVLMAMALGLIMIWRIRLRPAALLLIGVPVLAVGANLLRVMLSSLFAAWGRANLNQGTPHELLGLLVLFGSGALLFAFGSAVSARDDVQPPTPPPNGGAMDAAAVTGSAPSRTRLALACAVLAVGGILGLGIQYHYSLLRSRESPEAVPGIARQPLRDFPTTVGAYKMLKEGDLLPEHVEMLAPTDRLSRVYASPVGDTLALTLLYWAPTRIQAQSRGGYTVGPHSPDICFPASGWTREKGADYEDHLDWLPRDVLHARFFSKPDGSRHTLLFWYKHPAPEKIPFSLAGMADRLRLLAASWRSPRVIPVPSGYGVMIGVPGGEDDPHRARSVAIAFARAIAPLLPDYGIGRRGTPTAPAPASP